MGIAVTVSKSELVLYVDGSKIRHGLQAVGCGSKVLDNVACVAPGHRGGMLRRPLSSFNLTSDIVIGNRVWPAEHGEKFNFRGSIALLGIYTTTLSDGAVSCLFHEDDARLPLLQGSGTGRRQLYTRH